MRARIETVKDFISLDEQAELNNWALLAVQNKWLDTSTAFASGRLTTRMYGDRFETPRVALSILSKVREQLGLKDAPIIDGHGRDGIVVSYTYPGGFVHPHFDPPTLQGAALRCNIITQAPDSGGSLFVDGKRVLVAERELHCYAVSAWEHWIEEVTGDTPRILWMFGFGVPLDDWENGVIKMDGNI